MLKDQKVQMAEIREKFIKEREQEQKLDLLQQTFRRKNIRQQINEISQRNKRQQQRSEKKLNLIKEKGWDVLEAYNIKDI